MSQRNCPLLIMDCGQRQDESSTDLRTDNRITLHTTCRAAPPTRCNEWVYGHAVEEQRETSGQLERLITETEAPGRPATACYTETEAAGLPEVAVSLETQSSGLPELADSLPQWTAGRPATACYTETEASGPPERLVTLKPRAPGRPARPVAPKQRLWGRPQPIVFSDNGLRAAPR